MTSDLFERAAAEADCVEIATRHKKTALKAGRTSWSGVCPLRNCGAKSKKAPFKVIAGGARWLCMSCDPRGGDAVDLEHRLYGRADESMADTARRIIGGETREESETSRRRREVARDEAEKRALEDAAWNAEFAIRTWREAVPAAGTLVQTYLEEARGIRGPVAAAMLGQLRFHPAVYHSGDPAHGVRLPGMVGLPMTELGPPGGIHVTYLRPDGRGKTHRSPDKRMWGPQSLWLLARQGDRMGPPDIRDDEDRARVKMWAGIWLTRPDAPGPLVSGEGIENAASRAMMLGGDLHRPVRAVAALSLDRLQGFEAVEAVKVGRQSIQVVDVARPTGDVLRPPFTWPEDPRAPWGVIDIPVDADMSPVTVMGQTGANRAGKRRVAPYRRDSAERARVCGLLAKAAWTRRLAPGSETVVRVSRPPAGMDFNDIVRAAEAAREGGVA